MFGCNTPEKGVALQESNSSKFLEKQSQIAREEKKAACMHCPPPPLLRIRLATWTQSGRQHAGSPLIHSNKGCVCHIVSARALSPLIPSSNSLHRFVCERVWKLAATSTEPESGGKQRRRRRNLSLAGWRANGGTGAGMRRRASQRVQLWRALVTSQPPGRCLALTSPC